MKIKITEANKGSYFKVGQNLTILDGTVFNELGVPYNRIPYESEAEVFNKLSVYYKYVEIKDYPTLLHKIMDEEFGIEIGDKFNINEGLCNPYSLTENGFLSNRGTRVNHFIEKILLDNLVVSKVEPPKEVELTMEEIAEKFGVDINALRIKK